jgi:hypothetical protein
VGGYQWCCRKVKFGRQQRGAMANGGGGQDGHVSGVEVMFVQGGGRRRFKESR